MLLKPSEGREERVLPRLHHWVMATVTLFAIILVVPVIAGLT
ncbi:hypothetical protein VVT58_06000 [Sphingobium sp. SJ10-10]|nr:MULTISPECIES: hypothetical protein [Sphingomonadaceae]AMK22844.1 hypothetical protein K426_09495 [Sphingobium sp. TKS]MEC6698277.1 hypothetical protein [Sphingobium sp. SJ10-10]